MTMERPVDDLSREELEDLVSSLRAEVARLRNEIRLIQRDRHETPPHYL
jgi:ribosomal protein L29